MAANSEHQRLRARYAACVAMGLEDAVDIARDLGLSTAEVDAHRRSRRHALDDWQPRRFDEFTALPPGRFDPRVFQQTTWWVDILRRPHRINDREDFTDDHLAAVIAFVQREAWRWAEFPDLEDDDLVDPQWFRTESVARIRRTPLFEALVTENRRRDAAT